MNSKFIWKCKIPRITKTIKKKTTTTLEDLSCLISVIKLHQTKQSDTGRRIEIEIKQTEQVVQKYTTHI